MALTLSYCVAREQWACYADIGASARDQRVGIENEGTEKGVPKVE